MLYKELYNIIEEYANIQYLNNFLNNKQSLLYKCDKCDTEMVHIKKQNQILYELNDFDNKLLYSYVENYNINDFLLFSKTDIRNCIYVAKNLIFCDKCCKNINRKLLDFNYCNYGLCNYITKKHYLFIKMNNCFYIQDFITDSFIIINRISYEFSKNEEVLMIRGLLLNDDKNIIKLIGTNFKYNKMKNIIEKYFNLDFNFLNKYLKEKSS